MTKWGISDWLTLVFSAGAVGAITASLVIRCC